MGYTSPGYAPRSTGQDLDLTQRHGAASL